MQLHVAFIASAVLAAAAPTMAATLTFFQGADCTGSSLPISTGSQPGDCVFLTQGGSARSIRYSGVPNSIEFYKSGGPNDICTGSPSDVRSDGSGCDTAPAG
ncbi:hypothetical protein B0H15DRAFT_847095, partial [Mycena belliarum]